MIAYHTHDKTEKEWINESWKKVDDTKIDITADKMTRISVYEPIQFYPFDQSKVVMGEFKGRPEDGRNQKEIESIF